MIEINETPKVLQWVRGDKLGNVEHVIHQDDEWTTFQSGARIANNLINEYMIYVEGEPLDINNSLISNTVEIKSADKLKPIENLKQGNPIQTLFKKQKNKDYIEFAMNISINVPTIDFFTIIKGTFEHEETIDELHKFIIEQIDDTNLKKKLNESILNLIKDRYQL